MRNKNILSTILATLTLMSAAVIASAHTPLIHLINGGFESTLPNGVNVNGWNPYGTGYAIDLVEQHAGAQCLRCDSGDSTSIHGAVANVEIDQLVPTPIVLTGWSKASDVGGIADLDYSLYVDVAYVDGTYLYGQLASFDIGTHDWQKRKLVINPEKAVKSISVYALFRHHTGTVWFDDFDAHEGAE
jgi:hypothetical protein